MTTRAAGFLVRGQVMQDSMAAVARNSEQIDNWLRTTLVYGLAFVFLSLFCMIVLWVFWRLSYHGVSVVATLREWLPNWFAAQIESHKAVVRSADLLTERGGVHEKVDDTQRGLHHTVTAVRIQAKKHKDWDSDAMMELDRAAMILKPKDQ